jgi:hypothetical protein
MPRNTYSPKLSWAAEGLFLALHTTQSDALDVSKIDVVGVKEGLFGCVQGQLELALETPGNPKVDRNSVRFLKVQRQKGALS